MKQESFSYYAASSASQVMQELGSSVDTGLSQQEAARRLAQYGPNEIALHSESWISFLVNQVRSPFIYLLLGAGSLLFFLQRFAEGALLIAIVLLNALLGFYQEYRSMRVLMYLRRFLLTRVTVLRNGVRESQASKQLVPGDIIFFQAGDRIVADVRVIKETNFLLDESLLTGESMPVKKESDPCPGVANSFQAKNICFTGTTVVSGSGMGVVIATGKESYFGDISALTADTARLSSFSKGISLFSGFLMRLMFVSITVLLVIRVGLLHSTHINLSDFFIFAIALAVTIIPEALPVVITFCLSQGALLMAQKKVVVKRLTAIEDLGDMEILCIDKTGTITENRMAVARVYARDEHAVLEYAFLAGSEWQEKHATGKGFDNALYASLNPEGRQRLSAYTRVAELPFSAERRASLVLVAQKGTPQDFGLSQSDATGELIVRGAIEVVLTRCATQIASETESIRSWVAQEGAQGRRVLAVAKKAFPPVAELNEAVQGATDFDFVGAISFSDPIKKTVHQALHRAQKLGIAVKMLSGDSPEVCGAVALEVGLVHDKNAYLTGEQFSKLSESAQLDAVERYAVFSRILPQQKYQIVQLLERSHAVGYLGDGINDAPALKVANVGLAVSEGAEIAKEAADIILLKKSLAVIIDGVEEGRKVFANTMKYIRTSLASTFGNFYSLGIASFFITFLPMLPVQLVLVNFLSDFPLLAIATDNVDPDELKRPKKYAIKKLMLLVVIFGLISSLFDFVFFAAFYAYPPAVFQTGWFVESVLQELAFFYAIRTAKPFFKALRPSWPIVASSGFVLAVIAVLALAPWAHENIGFAQLNWRQLGLIILIMIIYFATVEIVKAFYYRANTKHENSSQTF